VVEQFTKIVKDARTQFINERINERLKTALSANQSESTAEDIVDSEETDEDTSPRDGIETTQDELDGFNVVKAILREVVDVSRVTMRDTKSYCGILLDDNNRKPICRLRFNTSQKYLGLFSNKNEEKVEIDNVDDIFKFADRVKAVIGEYEGNGKVETGEESNGGEVGNG